MTWNWFCTTVLFNYLNNCASFVQKRALLLLEFPQKSKIRASRKFLAIKTCLDCSYTTISCVETSITNDGLTVDEILGIQLERTCLRIRPKRQKFRNKNPRNCVQNSSESRAQSKKLFKETSANLLPRSQQVSPFRFFGIFLWGQLGYH